MKFKLELHNKNTPDNDLLKDLKRVAETLNKNSVTIDEYNQNGKYHASTLQRRFGSWFTALEKSGLKKTRNLNISNEDFFKDLEEVWTKLGRQPKYTEMRTPLSKYSAGGYENRFGSWNKALKAFIDYINEDTEESETDITQQKQEKIKPIKRRTNRNISDRLRFRILMRDGFACSKCGRSPMNERGVELHIDHIIPWSKGGETIPENLETKCEKCNLGKGNAFQV